MQNRPVERLVPAPKAREPLILRRTYLILGYWGMKQANLPVENIQYLAYHPAELYRSGGQHGKQAPR